MIRINNKMSLINKIYIRLANEKTETINKIKLVNKEMCKLQQDDLCLRLVKLNNIDAMLDDAIKVVQYEIYGKKKKKEPKND